MTLILARIVDRNGSLLNPPNPAAQLIEDGNPVRNYTLDQIWDLALAQIEEQKKPKSLRYQEEAERSV